jgi:hypothetical protein
MKVVRSEQRYAAAKISKGVEVEPSMFKEVDLGMAGKA